MFDVSTLAASPLQTSAASARRDKSASTDDQDAGGSSFGDLVDRAGRQKSGREAGLDSNDDSGKAAPARDEETEKSPSSKITGIARDAVTAKSHKQIGQDATHGLKGQIVETPKSTAVPTAADELGSAEDQIAKIAGNAVNADIPITPETSETVDGQTVLDAGMRARMASALRHSASAEKTSNLQNVTASLEPGTAEVDGKLPNKGKEADRRETRLSASRELQALLGLEPSAEENTTAEAETDKHIFSSAKRSSGKEKAESEAAQESAPAADRGGHIRTQTPQEQPIAIAVQTEAKTADFQAADDAHSDTIGAVREKDAELPLRNLRSARLDEEEQAVETRDSATSASKTDFVTVLDSRRYLGLANETGNVSALAQAIRGDATWSHRVGGAEPGGASLSTEVNTLKLELNPEHLGSMTASLRLKGEELSVELRVDTIEAYRQLSGDQDSIVKALRDQGFAIDQVSVQLNPSARSDASQNSSQNGGQAPSDGGNQNSQSGNQGESARQRDDGARRNANQNNWMANDATSISGDPAVDRTSATSGDIYL